MLSGLARRAPARREAPASSPVVDAHLPTALAAVGAGGQPDLAAAVVAAAPSLAWGIYDKYPPDAIGASFRSGHAYASLVGPHGPFAAGDYDLGLFLIAPHVFYRNHRHAAPELYAPLTDPHGWRFAHDTAFDCLPAHVPVWNIPHRPHATKVGHVPFLCLYAWTRDVTEPAVVVAARDWPEFDTD